jgi:hypothetical protein
MDATHTLLAGAIDYAGLFPPAQLGMVDALRNYAEYRRGADSWALGRFVVPANRLDILGATLDALPDEPVGSWPLSVLAGPRLAEDLEIIAALDARFRTEAVEVRAAAAEEIDAIAALVGSRYETYIELPLESDVPVLVHRVGEHGLRAKMRTGGITPDAIPAAEAVVRFLAACTAAGVPFKATAGLHHPRRGAYRLTYEIAAATAPMHGYLNVFAAAALLRTGATEEEALGALLETDLDALRVEESAVIWRGRRLDERTLAAMRREGMTAFGSCSFREPLEELAETHAR